MSKCIYIIYSEKKKHFLELFYNLYNFLRRMFERIARNFICHFFISFPQIIFTA